MKAIVSTLFRVISFPHDGRVVTVDQLSFIDPDWIASLNGSYMQTVSPLPHVNYVALSPMPSVVDADEPLTVSSLPYDLDSEKEVSMALLHGIPSHSSETKSPFFFFRAGPIESIHVS
jgi:hypothetical protein